MPAYLGRAVWCRWDKLSYGTAALEATRCIYCLRQSRHHMHAYPLKFQPNQGQPSRNKRDTQANVTLQLPTVRRSHGLSGGSVKVGFLLDWVALDREEPVGRQEFPIKFL